MSDDDFVTPPKQYVSTTADIISARGPIQWRRLDSETIETVITEAASAGDHEVVRLARAALHRRVV